MATGGMGLCHDDAVAIFEQLVHEGWFETDMAAQPVVLFVHPADWRDLWTTAPDYCAERADWHTEGPRGAGTGERSEAFDPRPSERDTESVEVGTLFGMTVYSSLMATRHHPIAYQAGRADRITLEVGR